MDYDFIAAPVTTSSSLSDDASMTNEYAPTAKPTVPSLLTPISPHLPAIGDGTIDYDDDRAAEFSSPLFSSSSNDDASLTLSLASSVSDPDRKSVV